MKMGEMGGVDQCTIAKEGGPRCGARAEQWLQDPERPRMLFCRCRAHLIPARIAGRLRRIGRDEALVLTVQEA
jgi:hypothetical protein